MSDFVQDERIPIEEIIRKIHPEDLVHPEGRKMMSLTENYGVAQPRAIKEPPLPVLKKRLRI